MELTLAPGAYRYDGGYSLLTQLWSCRDSLLFIMGACLLLFAVLAVYLCCAAGRKPGSEEVHAAGFNCIPLDIYLAGGGALLRGLDKRLSDKLNIPFHIAEDPLRAVARGTGIALKNVDKFSFLIR